jgi:hypothetical protein
MDVLSVLKNVGGVLATVTTLVYVSGYLALRARAFTLGTDPAFTLAYEGYVFAGFRFVFISLIILLILSPSILALRFAALWMKDRVPGFLLHSGQWLLVVLLAICTLFITVKILSVNGVLLQVKSSEASSPLESAVLGGQVGIAFLFAVFLLTALSALWLIMRLPAANDPLTWVLGIVVALQLFLLPMFYGSLYADRQVRVLAAIPPAVKGLKEPLGIVDRTSDHVTLLGLNDKGERRLVAIKLDALDGIPIKEIVTLRKFVQNELVHAAGTKEESVPDKASQKNATSKDISGTAKGFFQQLIESLHVTFQRIGSLGESAVASGQIWSVEFDASGKPVKPIKISAADDLAWPVLGPSGRIYAIQKGRIVQLGNDGRSITKVDKQKQWIKLFGVTEQGDVLGMIYENNESILASLRSDGKIRKHPTPASEEEEKRKSILEQENRAYAGDRSLYVERSTRGGRGFDVFLKKGEEVINVSDCGDDACGQPSLSPDFRRVLYVRKARY